MKKYIPYLLSLAAVSLLSPALPTAADAKNVKGSEKTEQAAPATQAMNDYNKLFMGKKHEEKKGMITLHNVEGKIYFEIPLKLMKRDMLIGSTISQITDNSIVTVGEKPHAPVQFHFEKADKKINLCKKRYDLISDDANVQRSLEMNSISSIVATYDIKAYNADSSAVVIDLTELLLGDTDFLSPLQPTHPSNPMKMNKKFRRELSQVKSIKAFSDNVSICSSLSYNVSMTNSRQRAVMMSERPFTVEVTRSIILLPEEPMRPRIADPRIGIFFQGKSKFSNDDEWVKAIYYTHRWRMEPSDPEAYARGEMVEPVKPIIFYIDDNFPESWRPYVYQGVEQWQKAFEKIGFKNAIIARDFPKDDPEFDPDNIKYNCVRYAPSWTMNAMGPSWTDPRTGEILNASVYVYHNLVKLVQTWRFVQTAPADPAVRSVKISPELLGNSITYVLSHEVGHCLGLMHNMAGSSSIPVDSLRSPSFTQRYGTTYSIMDYARNNFIAQPGDKERGVRLTPPELGEYDYYAIDWLYRPIPEAKNAEEELPVLRQWITEKSADPVYRYGKQQFGARIDPSGFEEDLGDDPVKAAEYGTKNLKYILSHINEWVAEEDPEFEFRITVLNELISHYQRMLTRVMYNIGGIYLNECFEGDARPAYLPVSYEDQRKSTEFILNQLSDLSWVDNPEVKRGMPLSANLAPQLTLAVFRTLLKRAPQVDATAQLMEDKAYTVNEFMKQIYDYVWRPTQQRRDLTPSQRDMQSAFIDYLLSGSSLVASAPMPGRPGGITAASGIIPLPESVLERSRKDFGIIPEEFLGIFTNREGGADFRKEEYMGFAPFKGMQTNTPATHHIYFGLINRSLSLLKARKNTGNEETRLHYRLLIYKLEQELN